MSAPDPHLEPEQTYRIGIDVGGTFTKAVLLDNATRGVVGRAAVHTTHDHPRGVAAGVIEVFRQVLSATRVSPASVVFIAHSTTQATNALLEGDVAHVGVIGMASRAAAQLAEPQSRIAPIELAPGCVLKTSNRFLVSDQLDNGDIERAVSTLVAEGADVLVASAAFGVDNTGTEEAVRRIGTAHGLPTTCGHEITRLYGLAVRTRTAVINASILPRMIATANMTEASIREAGITAPLMIMRGDGGAMLITEMHRRPAMTMLSGPAASVAGSLMHLKVSDGFYFEVGGTSTNIAVIQSGRPSITYAQVGGHDTYVSSLDVRVLGVAGGSLIRAREGRIADVGPRSAHIAGLPYAAFASLDQIKAPQLEFFEPKLGDGADYMSIRTASGERFALTTTCAANALGVIPAGAHSRGSRDAARAAFAPLAAYLGVDVDTAARQVLLTATDKLIPVIDALTKQYRLDADQRMLIAVGGGAGTLGPFLAERLGLRYEIAPDAEVISSIGAATAMVREVVERVLPHASSDDLLALRQEAIEAAVKAGADRDSIDVTIELDKPTGRARAVAMGAAELQTGHSADGIIEPRARDIAARSLAVPAAHLTLAAETTGARAYVTDANAISTVRVVDRDGRIRLQRSRALVRRGLARNATTLLNELWHAAHTSQSDQAVMAGLFLMHGLHIVDLSGIAEREQIVALMQRDLAETDEAATIGLVLVMR